MPRYKLIAARLRAELSPSELARRIKCERKAVNRWERGEAEPRMEYRGDIRRELGNNDDPHLFTNYLEGHIPLDVADILSSSHFENSEPALSSSCRTETSHN